MQRGEIDKISVCELATLFKFFFNLILCDVLMVVLTILRNSQDQMAHSGQLSSKRGGSMLASTTDGAFWKNLKWWCWSPKARCPEDEQTAASNRAPC